MSSAGQTELVEAAAPELEEETAGWTIPFNSSLDGLDKITMACFQAKADQKQVSAEEISRIAGFHARTTTPNLRFLASIGVLVLDSSEKEYTLSEKGAEYAKCLGSNDLEKAGIILKELLPSSHLNELLGYITVQGDSLKYSTLFDRIKTLARVKLDQQGNVGAPTKAGIRCLMALLARANFVSSALINQQEIGRAVSVTGKKTARQSREARGPVKTAEKTGIADHGLGQDSGTSFVNVNILIEAKDPESIKQVIELIKYLRTSQDR